MPGHSDSPQLHNVLWTDAEIEAVSVDYSAVRIVVLESTGRRLNVLCRGYIGYSVVGFWDEVVVERADCDSADPFLAECLRSLQSRHGAELPESGSPERDLRSWSVLRVLLSDGVVLKVAAADWPYS